MCGRYASTRSREDQLETFKIEEALADEEKAPDYNVAPTKTSPTVLARPPRGADEETDPVRQLRNLKCGLVPSWAKDPNIGNRLLCTSQVVGEDVSLRWVRPQAFNARGRKLSSRRDRPGPPPHRCRADGCRRRPGGPRQDTQQRERLAAQLWVWTVLMHRVNDRSRRVPVGRPR